jgi:hypothetical protein
LLKKNVADPYHSDAQPDPGPGQGRPGADSCGSEHRTRSYIVSNDFYSRFGEAGTGTGRILNFIGPLSGFILLFTIGPIKFKILPVPAEFYPSGPHFSILLLPDR